MLQDIGKRNDFAPPIIITVPDHLIDRIVSRNHQTKGIVFLGITNGEFQQIRAIVNRERFSLYSYPTHRIVFVSLNAKSSVLVANTLLMPWRESNCVLHRQYIFLTQWPNRQLHLFGLFVINRIIVYRTPYSCNDG